MPQYLRILGFRVLIPKVITTIWYDFGKTLFNRILAYPLWLAGKRLTKGDNMNLKRIQNRLSGIISVLETEGDTSDNERMRWAVTDCLLTDISDKDRLKFYGTARLRGELDGYIEHFPPAGSRDSNPQLVEAFEQLAQDINAFVVAGLKKCPNALIMQRPKGNKANIINYTQESLINTMINSGERWYTEQYKNENWNGSVATMADITIPQQEPATEEVQE